MLESSCTVGCAPAVIAVARKGTNSVHLFQAVALLPGGVKEGTFVVLKIER